MRRRRGGGEREGLGVHQDEGCGVKGERCGQSSQDIL